MKLETIVEHASQKKNLWSKVDSLEWNFEVNTHSRQDIELNTNFVKQQNYKQNQQTMISLKTQKKTDLDQQKPTNRNEKCQHLKDSPEATKPKVEMIGRYRNTKRGEWGSKDKQPKLKKHSSSIELKHKLCASNKMIEKKHML